MHLALYELHELTFRSASHGETRFTAWLTGAHFYAPGERLVERHGFYPYLPPKHSFPHPVRVHIVLTPEGTE